MTINDKRGGSVLPNTTAVTVADAPLTADPTATISAAEGIATGSCVVAKFTDADPYAPAADFSGTIDWGDHTPPTNFNSSSVSAVPGSPGTFTVSGSYTYAVPGTYYPTVTITDVGGSSLTAQKTTINVADAPTPSQTPVTVAAVEGVPTAANTVLATFTDTDPKTSTSGFSGTIDWGDGSATPFTSANVIKVSSGPLGVTFNVRGSHAYAVPGSYPVTVTINQRGGSVTANNTTISVADAPLTAKGSAQTAKVAAGVQFTRTLAEFTDGDPSAVANFENAKLHDTLGDYTATINWGDGTTRTVTNLTAQATVGDIVVDGSGFDVVGTHIYAMQQSYFVTVTITDVGGSHATVYTAIADPPPPKASASVNDAALMSILGGSNGSNSGSSSNKAIDPAALGLLYGSQP